MKSSRSKVLFPVAGRALLHYPVAAAFAAGASHVVCVVSPDNHDDVLAALREDFGDRVSAKVQDPPRGTGDAARVGLDRPFFRRRRRQPIRRRDGVVDPSPSARAARSA